jgi:hypothetical protein
MLLEALKSIFQYLYTKNKLKRFANNHREWDLKPFAVLEGSFFEERMFFIAFL